MGQTKTADKWAKLTKREWTDDIIQQADVIGIADEDVGLLVDEDGSIMVDADVIEVCEEAAKVERKKLAILLREYGRAYCDEAGSGYKGTGKAQTSYAVTQADALIDLADASEGKRKPVTAALVSFAEAFGKRFGK